MIFQNEYEKWNGIDNKTFENTSPDKKTFNYSEEINVLGCNKIRVKVTGTIENSGGYITLNDEYNIPINSTSTIDVSNIDKMTLKLIVAVNSKVKLKNLSISELKTNDLIDTIDIDKNTLVIVPDYPSYVNLYVCAFAHSRCKEYVKNGLKIQVFAVNEGIKFQTKYTRDNVPVMKGTYEDLKNVLKKKKYPVVIVHFVNSGLYPIFEKYVYDNQKMIFICHGPETVYKYLVNKTRPYFTEEISASKIEEMFKEEDQYVKKFSKKDNVEWVFVSDWLKEFSEEQQGFKFKNSRVINNIIDEDLFPYTERNPELRKKILVVRKFDNISQHSIDQVVLSILELSRRKIFADLEFDIYGDGNYYDELVKPLRKFDNVHLIRKFVPNEKLNEIYSKHGIMMLPSRHDAHAVSMGESASTGLVVLGSTVTSNPYFMNQEENHTLTDPEDFKALADVVERLYNDPKEFLRVSKNMAVFTRQFNKKNTVHKEIELIKNSLDIYQKEMIFKIKKKTPKLTIVMLTENDEDNVESSLISILRAKNIEEIEVVVIDNNSADKTREIIKKYEKMSSGIIKLIKSSKSMNKIINEVLKNLTSKYVRFMLGKDWINSEELDKFIDILKTDNSDLILTSGSNEYIDKYKLEKFDNYTNLKEGTAYHFDDIVGSKYGFNGVIDLLSRGNFNTKILNQYLFSERLEFLNIELNNYVIPKVDTVSYYNLDLYRNCIEKDDNKEDYREQKKIIFKLLDNLNELGFGKKKYMVNNFIVPMIDKRIIIYDELRNYSSLDRFIKNIKKYSNIYDELLEYINTINGKSALILMEYPKRLESDDDRPIVIPGCCENVEQYRNYKIRKNGKIVRSQKIIRFIKKSIKMIIPYGMVRLIQKARKQ